MKGKTRSLSDVVQPRRSKVLPSDYPELPYIGLEHVEAHTTRLLGTVPAIEMRSAANHFQPGDVLYSRLRPYLNKVWRADREGLCSSEFIVLPGNNQVDADFLRYRLNAHDFVSFATHLNTGDRPRVDFDQISVFETWLPRTVTDQRRIVAEIEKQFTRLEAGVTALKRVQANLKRYRAAVLKSACENKLLVAKGAPYKKQSLASLGKWCGGGTPSKTNRAFWTSGKIPWVSPKDMKTEVIADAIDHITKAAVEQSTTNIVPENSVLVVTRSGILQHTLPVAVTTRPVAINQDLKALQLSIGYDTRYVALALRAYQRDILHQCSKTGTTVQNIEFPVFLRFEIPVPPLADQKRIVAEVERRLSVVEELEAAVKLNLERAAKLRQAVLQKAFSGELV